MPFHDAGVVRTLFEIAVGSVRATAVIRANGARGAGDHKRQERRDSAHAVTDGIRLRLMFQRDVGKIDLTHEGFSFISKETQWKMADR